MLALNEVELAVSKYLNNQWSVDQFEDWFYDNSRSMFGESPEVLSACMSIDEALSRYHFEGERMDLLKTDLAAIGFRLSERPMFRISIERCTANVVSFSSLKRQSEFLHSPSQSVRYHTAFAAV